METQLKKGVLELCVLAMLQTKDCYGYELVNEISQRIAISEGTIYPLLRRLRNDNFVETYLQESTGGPPRKYYTLTAEGQEEIKTLSAEWLGFSESVNNFLKGLKND